MSGVAHAQDLDCRHFRFREDAQAELDRDPSDPNRLDEDQGPDDGIACEALPRRNSAGAVPPVTPRSTTVPPVHPSAGSGPPGLTMGMSLTLTAGSTMAAGYLTTRRLPADRNAPERHHGTRTRRGRSFSHNHANASWCSRTAPGR